jgi:hypothetical protein
VFPVRYGQTYRFELSFKYSQKTGRRIMSRIVIVIFPKFLHHIYFSFVAFSWFPASVGYAVA